MKWIALFVAVALVACHPAPVLTPFAAAAPNTQLVHLLVETAPPTQTPKPLFITFTPPPSLFTPTAVETSTPTISTPLNATVATWTPPASWTPPPLDSGAQAPAHFLLNWPIANSGAHTLSRVYPYGGTYNGALQVHHGVDLVNSLGTPLFAAGDGTVFYAGDDFTTRFGPENNYYGYLVIIQHNFLSPERLPVYSLYGHMLQLAVQTGQALKQGDVIGTVGATGVARGAHVHFEVRVGDPYDFDATRNPELWLRPFPNEGVLAGRVTDANGMALYGMTLTVQSSQITRTAYSYVDDTVHPDPTLGENFVLGDLPPDYYAVTVRTGRDGIERFAQSVYVQPNQVTWIEVRLSPE
ncbi:MAG: peptidoglycan DD-metalloendopeptidase family protein [Chloroflexota bacterium]